MNNFIKFLIIFIQIFTHNYAIAKVSNPPTDSSLQTSDITTNNFTTSKHGFVPKGTNAGNYLKDDGTWAAVSGGGGAGSNVTFAPTTQRFTSGSGTYNRTFAFATSTASATSGATYTNNGVTYTVSQSVTAGTTFYMTGASSPLASGTLTRASGTGDPTIAFSYSSAPMWVEVEMAGAGGGGSGGGTTSVGAGNNATSSTFGSNVAGGGNGGAAGGANGGSGGGVTQSIGTRLYAMNGGAGGSPQQNVTTNAGVLSGGYGGTNLFGGGGVPTYASTGGAGVGNAGSGGAGGAMTSATASDFSGSGGGAGAYFKFSLSSAELAASGTFSYTVGAGGTGGTAGTNGAAGGSGSDGVINIREYFQYDAFTSNNSFSEAIFTSNAVTPSNPSAGLKVYNKTGSLYSLNSGGNEILIPNYFRQNVVLTATSSTSSITPADVPILTSASLGSGVYQFRMAGKFQTAATTTGIGVRLTTGTGTIGDMFITWLYKQAADGTAAYMQVAQLAPTTDVPSTAVLAANTNYPFNAFGYFTMTASGTVKIQLRTEVAASLATLASGTNMVIERVDQ
jgi:hypothetical protein